mmetsp:Transcript_24879/g.63107  ORF Transcript_24879/g.63107 Transcript_24879/m.63107 type:complete len:212 (-) Transcript_24879:164-799(-)
MQHLFSGCGGAKVAREGVVRGQHVAVGGGLDHGERGGKVLEVDGAQRGGGQARQLRGRHLADGAHGRLLAQRREVGRGEALGGAHERGGVGGRQPVRRGLQQVAQDGGAALGRGQRDVDALDQPPAHRVVDLVRPVGGPHHHHSVGSGRDPHAVKLHQELGLEAARCVVLVGAPARAQQRVNLIDEDDGGRLLRRHREQRAHQLLALAHPL